MARTDDKFLANVDGEIYAIRSGGQVFGIAGADGQAEEARQAAEAARQAAEEGRASAESLRVQAEQQRAADQAKNNADQEMNNQRMQVLYPRILTTGEYDPDTLVPTIEDPETGRQYLVPLTPPVEALSLTSAEARAAEGGNAFVEWMWVEVSGEFSWEKMGVSQMEVTPITTDEIDDVVADGSPQGADTLTTTGLSYFWSKLKSWATGAFAALSHTHAESEVTGLEVDLQEIRDSLSQVPRVYSGTATVSGTFSDQLFTDTISFGRSMGTSEYRLLLTLERNGVPAFASVHSKTPTGAKIYVGTTGTYRQESFEVHWLAVVG